MFLFGLLLGIVFDDTHVENRHEIDEDHTIDSIKTMPPHSACI